VSRFRWFGVLLELSTVYRRSVILFKGKCRDARFKKRYPALVLIPATKMTGVFGYGAVK
jgi:hypothetical protein